MKHFSIALILAAGAWAGLTGCGDSSSGEFREFTAEDHDKSVGERGSDVAQAARASPGAVESDQADGGVEPERSSAAIAGGAVADEPVEAPAPVGPRSSVNGDQIAAVSPLEIPAVNGIDPRVRSRPGDPVVDNQPTEPREIKLLVKDATFRAEGSDGALRVSYDDLDLLKVLNMDPVPVDAVDHFPRWLKGLDGKRIRIRGFMYPPYQETDLPFFVLARDNQICCFGRDAKIYDLIHVVLREGVTTDYIQNRPFDVVGVFHIKPEASDGEMYQLYVIDDAIVIDK